MSAKPQAAPRPLAIAIVDDEPSVRTSLSRLCEALGMQPTPYASGAEFILAIEQHASPDCLLLDAHMCEMTGLEVHEQLSRRGVGFPTIIITADDAPEVEFRYRSAGVSAYLRKPVGSEELVTVIEEAVHAHSTNRARTARRGKQDLA